MKRIIKLLALAATLAVFAVPTLAQKQECTDDNKGTWYKTFYDNYKGDAAQQKLASAPPEAITDLLKVAKIESDVKKNPQLYLDLAAAYEAGPRAKLSKDYTDSLNPADKTETDQSKVILENLNRVIDNQIDAMARAAAFTSDAAKKKEIVAELA